MPRPGCLWRHVNISTARRWLHGDRRGFRDHNHRIHSCGDYKSPPPAGEHADLHHWVQRRTAAPVTIPPPLREVVGMTFIAKLRALDCRVLAVSIDHWHVHALAEMPADEAAVRKLVGRAKQAASHAVRSDLPGRLWAQGGEWPVMGDERHQREVFGYIVKHAEQGAWVWVAPELRGRTRTFAPRSGPA